LAHQITRISRIKIPSNRFQNRFHILFIICVICGSISVFGLKAPHVADDGEQGEGVDLPDALQFHAAQHERLAADLLILALNPASPAPSGPWP
jgi:hypothetical protein